MLSVFNKLTNQAEQFVLSAPIPRAAMKGWESENDDGKS
jgi:hypothetical protein